MCSHFIWRYFPLTIFYPILGRRQLSFKMPIKRVLAAVKMKSWVLFSATFQIKSFSLNYRYETWKWRKLKKKQRRETLTSEVSNGQVHSLNYTTQLYSPQGGAKRLPNYKLVGENSVLVGENLFHLPNLVGQKEFHLPDLVGENICLRHIFHTYSSFQKGMICCFKVLQTDFMRRSLWKMAILNAKISQFLNTFSAIFSTKIFSHCPH